MRLHICSLVLGIALATGPGAAAQSSIESELRERVALRLAANDPDGAIALAEQSANSGPPEQKFAGWLVLAELHFARGDRSKAFAVIDSWRKQWSSKSHPGVLAPGDLVEVLDPQGKVLERGIIGLGGELRHIADVRLPQLAGRSLPLPPNTVAALSAHYGGGVQLRAYRSEQQVYGVPPQESAPQDTERVKQVRDLLAKTNLPRQSEKEAAQLDALRRLGPAAMEAAEKLWMSEEESSATRVNAAYLIATEDPQRLLAILPRLKGQSAQSSASVLLQAFEARGIPPALAAETFRAGWLGLLESPSVDVRDSALQVLDTAFPEAIAERLPILAVDPDPRVRQRVMQQVLPRLAWNDAVLAVVRERLRDGAAVVRELAVQLLGERKVLTAADALQVLREDSSAEVRARVLNYAQYIEGPREELEQLLLQGLQDPGSSVQNAALQALVQGAVRSIESAQIAEQLMRRATSSDVSIRNSAMRAAEHLGPALIGPTAEEMLQKVSRQSWLETPLLAVWAQNRRSQFAKTSLRPSIWLERRPWFSREPGLIEGYDKLIAQSVISRLERDDLPAWLGLVSAGRFQEALIERAVSVDAELLRPVFADPRTSDNLAKTILRAVGGDARVIEWARSDPRWSSHQDIVNEMSRFRDHSEARALFLAWFELGPPEGETARRAWQNTIANWVNLASNARDPWLVSVVARHLPDAGSHRSAMAAYLHRIDEGIVLPELEKNLARYQERSVMTSLMNVLYLAIRTSARAQQFWVSHIAPHAEIDAERNGELTGGFHPSEASPVLVELFRRWSTSDRAFLRRRSCEFWNLRLTPDARERLLELMRDADAEVRKAAVGALGNFDDMQVVDVLTAAAMEGNPEVRAGALSSLERLRTCFEAKRFWSSIRADGGEDPLAKILPLLRDPDTEVRSLAIDSLGALGSPRALPHLLELFKAGAEPEKSAARRAIERIQKAVDAERAKGGEPPAPAPDKGVEAEKKKDETAGGGRDR